MDKVTHFELPVDDMDRAEAFYQKLFGWNIMKMPMGDGPEYRMVGTVRSDEQGMPQEMGGINGGLMMRSMPGEQGVLVINVDDVVKKMEEAKAAGATVVMEIMNVMDMGLYGRIKDTEGNIVGIWQNLPKQAA